ncbi:unnamed protein product [Tuber melanosporum]|uniref:(Perigord truffle) hypothetical protein n=1 Tax=Tuber melanosporum (strain Mel28) TaxID=656061 RepID=D5GML7_TUBMM|nr:uncharacterized protein GSTUM_00010802001 [Tuber melanosporum]CAZ85760.1 unnamed protein product [Tuber melanosporum]
MCLRWPSAVFQRGFGAIGFVPLRPCISDGEIGLRWQTLTYLLRGRRMGCSERLFCTIRTALHSVSAAPFDFLDSAPWSPPWCLLPPP